MGAADAHNILSFFPCSYWMHALKRSGCVFIFSKIKEYKYFPHAALRCYKVTFALFFLQKYNKKRKLK